MYAEIDPFMHASMHAWVHVACMDAFRLLWGLEFDVPSPPRCGVWAALRGVAPPTLVLTFGISARDPLQHPHWM